MSGRPFNAFLTIRIGFSWSRQRTYECIAPAKGRMDRPANYRIHVQNGQMLRG